MHPDGTTRILHFWDQSDTADGRPPVEVQNEFGSTSATTVNYSYGHEYTAEDINRALFSYDHSWDPTTNAFSPVDDETYPIRPSARDDHSGHGTHVAGTAVGNGRGSGLMGAAPLAHIIAVKFDFCGDRGDLAKIVDGVNFIFRRAENYRLGDHEMPTVVNLSLGIDLGPHDGSTLAERGIDRLVGPGKIVVAATGNSGRVNEFEDLSKGFALHGTGILGRDTITIRVPNLDDIPPGDPRKCGGPRYGYNILFDVWYGADVKCRVRVTAPSGKIYPSSFEDENESVWMTGGIAGEVNLAHNQGGIFVSNGVEDFDPLETFSATHDHELVIYLSGGDGGKKPLQEGIWTIEMLLLDDEDNVVDFTDDVDETFERIPRYEAWFDASGPLHKGWEREPHPRDPTPRFGERPSDNRMTVMTPAGAEKVIAVGAYASRLEWECYIATSGETSLQGYDEPPLQTKFNAFALGELAYFSGRGPRRDGVYKPEITAPGVGIASSFSHFARQTDWANGTKFFEKNIVLPNLEGAVFQGTSMASPNVAGGIALLLENDPTLDYDDVVDILKRTAIRDITTWTHTGYDPGAPVEHHVDTDPFTWIKGKLEYGDDFKTFNNDWGYGKMDIGAALAHLARRCRVDSDCDDANGCTKDTCNSTANECSFIPFEVPCVTDKAEAKHSRSGGTTGRVEPAPSMPINGWDNFGENRNDTFRTVDTNGEEQGELGLQDSASVPSEEVQEEAMEAVTTTNKDKEEVVLPSSTPSGALLSVPLLVVVAFVNLVPVVFWFLADSALAA